MKRKLLRRYGIGEHWRLFLRREAKCPRHQRVFFKESEMSPAPARILEERGSVYSAAGAMSPAPACFLYGGKRNLPGTSVLFSPALACYFFNLALHDAAYFSKAGLIFSGSAATDKICFILLFFCKIILTIWAYIELRVKETWTMSQILD